MSATRQHQPTSTPTPPPAPRAAGKIRTQLANERTFLAWLRTGMTTMALGIAAAHLLEDHQLAGVSLTKVLAGLLVSLGLVITLLGRLRFRQAAIGIRTETFRSRRREFEIVVIGVAIAGVIALLLTIRI